MCEKLVVTQTQLVCVCVCACGGALLTLSLCEDLKVWRSDPGSVFDLDPLQDDIQSKSLRRMSGSPDTPPHCWERSRIHRGMSCDRPPPFSPSPSSSLPYPFYCAAPGGGRLSERADRRLSRRLSQQSVSSSLTSDLWDRSSADTPGTPPNPPVCSSSSCRHSTAG